MRNFVYLAIFLLNLMPFAAVFGAPLLDNDESPNLFTRGLTIGNAPHGAEINLNILDFGGKCDGITDDTAAVATAARSSVPGTDATRCKTTIGYESLLGSFRGPGRIVTSDGNPRAPFFTALRAAPSAYGNSNSGLSAFTGDLTNIQTHEHQFTGIATLGQPSKGYFQPLENSAEVLDVYSTSGWNSSRTGNGGRTGASGRFVNVRQYGQGDLNAFFCSGVVASTKVGALSYLASPEAACLAGQLFGAANGAYIEGIGDLSITDNGYDIGAVGLSLGFNRANATEGIGANWIARYIGTVGSMPLDAVDRVNGSAAVGIDLSSMTMGYWRLASATMNSAGRDYRVGDVLTGPTVNAASPTILTVTGIRVGKSTTTAADATGPIATYTITNSGLYTANPFNGYTTLPVTGGTGTGVSFSGQYDANNAILLPSLGGCIKPGSVGSVVGSLSGIFGKLCIDTSGLSFGGLNNTRRSDAGSNNVQFGDRHEAKGKYNAQFGYGSHDNARYGGMYFASAMFDFTAGSAQTELHIFSGQTNTTQAVRLTLDGSAATNNNVLPTASGSTLSISWRATARNTSTGDYATWKLRDGVLNYPAGASLTYAGDASSALVPDRFSGAGADVTLTLSADTSLSGLNVTFTPPYGNAATWHVMMTAYIDQVR